MPQLNYYQTARKASRELDSHPGFQLLKKTAVTAKRILDIGCGEGTRLALITPPGVVGVGVDPSPQALALAKKQYPKLKFVSGVGEQLPFPPESFDLVYSAFSVEHCADPEMFISEMFRVCSKKGYIAILAPNYGAPNRRSPVSLESPTNKLLEGIVKDLFPAPGLRWDQVTPKMFYRRIDDDTTHEPYLKSLLSVLSNKGSRIVTSSSMWEMEAKPKDPHHFIFRALGGTMKLPPFKYWGPQVFVIAQKN